MSVHIFVDETKQRDYLMVAGVVLPHDLQPLRRAVRELLLPGQRRLHMKDESDPRRRAIISALVQMDIRATIYDAGRSHRTQRDARAACLRALVADAASTGAGMLILEQDDSLLSWDNQRLIEYTRASGCRDSLRYEHRRAAQEQLLAIPDAIAWSWAKGGDWKRRIQPIVNDVQEV